MWSSVISTNTESVCVHTPMFFCDLGYWTRLLKSPVCNVASPRCFPFPWKLLPSAKSRSVVWTECASMCLCVFETSHTTGILDVNRYWLLFLRCCEDAVGTNMQKFTFTLTSLPPSSLELSPQCNLPVLVSLSLSFNPFSVSSHQYTVFCLCL